MKTCANCIHYEVCDYHITEKTDMTVNECSHTFKDKSRYIELPCAVGDTVYVITYCRCGNPEAFEMKRCHKKPTQRTPKVYASVMKQQCGKRLKPNYYGKIEWEWKPIGTVCYKLLKRQFTLEMLTEFGKTVFLTQEEAERALKEREGK